MRFFPALAAACCWAVAAVPAQAQLLGLEIGVGGGVGAGVEIGSGAPSVSVSVGGLTLGLGGDGESPSEDGAGAGGGASTPTPSTSVLTQEAAVEAVRTKRAVPLEQVIATARLLTDGEVIDAQMIVVRGFLLYELRVLETTGDVVDLYFYARSGRAVRTE